ncbi:uncharacterized protein LOC131676801 [Topomyia yanbarensis]|uniref:uncharacterized protein LOC131676801 n=1 Tax=Topomyia yanbarensis TaxID=2498891 RepID=UPI00273C33E6|nr:uncharacterized protein LOC131676801 [Topomyia yanbarensis]
MSDLSELNRCRLCFSPNNLTDALFPASGSPNQELMGMIYACTSIRITFEKDFPCPICSSCVRIVNQFHAYRRKCLTNDRELKQLRDGKASDLSGEDEDGESDDETDPLSNASVKQEDTGYGRFYSRVKRQIRDFLETQVKEIERKALNQLNDALRQRLHTGTDIGLQMTVDESFGEQEPQPHDEEFNYTQESNEQERDYGQRTSNSSDGTDWKTKYLTLQKNNDLLQKAFREQKGKMKSTELMLKNYQEQSGIAGSSNSSMNSSMMEMVSPIEQSNHPISINGWPSGFTTHPAFPEISVDYLRIINYKSGPGEKGDRIFVSKLAVAVFGVETLANSSVTGRPSNAHNHLPPKPPLCPQKLAAIGLKLFERVQLEVGPANQEELLTRSHERLVRIIVCQKSMNLRKQFAKQFHGQDDDLESEPEKKKKKFQLKKA